LDQGENRQILFTTPLTGSWLGEQITDRQNLIDQLLAVNTNPTAARALQEARAILSSKNFNVSMLPQ
jgi:hypothetical protein